MNTMEQETYTRSNPRYVVAIRSWFDKVNGNSYFTGRIFGADEVLYIPFQYGNGDATYRNATMKVLGITYEPMDWENTATLIGLDYVQVSRKKDLHFQALDKFTMAMQNRYGGSKS